MKLGIMQPYFFPYIGYFQLIAAVDQFVVHDDVQWIKGGWINRNRILAQGEPRYITLPIRKDSTLLNINHRTISSDSGQQIKKILQQIMETYRHAPCFGPVFKLISQCLACRETNASAFIVHTLRECCNYLGIDTPFVLSSELKKKDELKGAKRVLEINRVMGARHYINPIGGMELYDKASFADNGIQLDFIRTRDISYQQFENHAFVPFLSIIDVMMFNSKQQIKGFLNEYDLC